MELSKRLQTVADMIKSQGAVADIGTDHAYIPIYLMMSGKIEHAIAMDVKKGPLLRAKENIEAYKLEDKIEVRLSDGLEKLKDSEADAIVIAGMGGALMARILADGAHAVFTKKELILQPQSEIYKVRRQLHKMGYQIKEEKMLIEEGKFYTVIRAVGGEEKYEKDIDYDYGAYLLEQKNEVLHLFLEKELSSCEKIERNLKNHDTKHTKMRLEQIEEEKKKLKEALSIYEK